MFFLLVASLGFISRIKNCYGIFCHFDGVSDKHLKIKGFLTKVILVIKWFFTASAKNRREIHLGSLVLLFLSYLAG